MMQLPIYQVDAFTGRLFAGNPAAVVPLENWLADDVLRAIAAENNLSETAFFVAEQDRFALRWFTPTREVDLCGHATLATAFVIFSHYAPERDALRFETASGELRVSRESDFLWLDFPARPVSPWNDAGCIAAALGSEPEAVYCTTLDNPESDKILAVFRSSAEVRALAPDMQALMNVKGQGVVATARGEGEVDFVSRYFVPKVGVPEDPVTGSTHCSLVPFWSEAVGRKRLKARQVSARGGEIECELDGDRVRLGGNAVLYLEGRINLA